MRIVKQQTSTLFLKSLPLLLLAIVLGLLWFLWSVQNNNVDPLARQIEGLKQQIKALPADVSPKDRLTLEKDRLTLEKDLVNAKNAVYATLVQTFGGAFFVVTAYLTYRNVRATEANVRAAEEKQVTERFSKAIELLGSEKIEIRLGGIYALERIAKDSPKDHWTIMEVLISFAQEKSPLSQNIQQRDEQSGSSYPTQGKPKITTDVQAVLTVIGRRGFNKEQDGQRIELPRTKLRGANLTKANLANANLTNADLTNADLTNADLTNADLTKATLADADLTKAILVNADLTNADLTKATLADADISEADFTGVYSNEARDKHKEAEDQAMINAYEEGKAHENNDYYYDEEQFLSEGFQHEGNKLLKNEISKAKGKPKFLNL